MMLFLITTKLIWRSYILPISIMKCNLFIYTVLFLVFAACESHPSEEKSENSTFIEITMEQFQSQNMQWGKLQSILMENSIICTGKLIPKKNGVAKIVAPVEGIIKVIHVQNGTQVKKNDVIVEIGGHSLIDLQHEYAASAAKLKQLKSEYIRLKALYKENIKTENEFLMAESNYKANQANYMALKAKLNNMGLSVEDIEKGNYVSTYKLRSPIDGQINNLRATQGQYVSFSNEVAEVQNPNEIQLELKLYDKNFSNIAIGQEVKFKTNDKNESFSMARITRVGKTIDPQSNSFTCYGDIKNKNVENILVNQWVNAEVITSQDSVWGVTQSAIISNGNDDYVLAKSKEENNVIFLEKIKVQIGKTDGSYVELINPPKEKDYIVKGLYNISIE